MYMNRKELELEAIAAEEDVKRRKANRYRKHLMRHPDCRDPDHPGCERCNGEVDEEKTD